MLKFKNSYIYNNNDKEIASLVDRFPVITGSERYAVYLNSCFDYMTADQIKSYIQAANAMETQTIVQAAMLKSFKQQLEQKLHDCLMSTDIHYKYEFETSQMKKEIENLQQQLDEERKKRWQLESELFELKHSLQDSKDECESEYEN